MSSFFTPLRASQPRLTANAGQPEHFAEPQGTPLADNELDPISKQLIQDMGPKHHAVQRRVSPAPSPSAEPMPSAPETPASPGQPPRWLAGGLLAAGAALLSVVLLRSKGGGAAALPAPTPQPAVMDDLL